MAAATATATTLEKQNNKSMRLLLSDPEKTILEDSKTLQQYENDIHENAVLYLVFAVGDNDNDDDDNDDDDDDNMYETVDIASTDFQEPTTTTTTSASGN